MPVSRKLNTTAVALAASGLLAPMLAGCGTYDAAWAGERLRGDGDAAAAVASERAERNGTETYDEGAAERAGAMPASSAAPPSAARDTGIAAQLSAAFRAAADEALPAVVFVRVIAEAPAEQVPWPFRGEEERQHGGGSGFIFQADGHILTNHHVVANTRSVDVLLYDGRQYPAEVVATDRDTDVAVIRIRPRDGERFPAARLGDSDRIRAGDWVLALGNPLGFDFTVTAGIVSGTSRHVGILGGQTGLESFIQTDAAINQGNSGGPLVDLTGRVVGINTAIASSTGYNAGYGFAIPINLARRVSRDLVAHGYVRRPRLGIGVYDVAEADAAAAGLDRIHGALVRSVDRGTPAADAGLQMGDIIVAIDGRELRNRSELMARLAEYEPGDEVRLTLARRGQRLERPVRLGQFDPPATRETAEARTRPEDLLGFEVAALTPQQAARLGLDAGVVIARVARLSPAANAGLVEGFILVSINGESVSSPADVQRLAAELEPGQVVSVVVRPPDRDAQPQLFNYRIRR